MKYMWCSCTFKFIIGVSMLMFVKEWLFKKEYDSENKNNGGASIARSNFNGVKIINWYCNR